MRDELLELVHDLRATVEALAADGARELADDRGVAVAAPSPRPARAPGPARVPDPPAVGADVPADVGVARVGADGLLAVRGALGDCRRCKLCAGRTNLVFGVGDPLARLVVIGEGPGEQEDRQGEPFVGPAGQMLDRMLENVLGLAREQVYIMNVVKCRPPGNRNPEPDEIAACRPFLEGQLRALRPQLALVLGSVAYKALFRTERGITSARGRWHDLDGLPVLPTFHPAYLLRKPDDKRYVFEDLKAVKARYDALPPRPPA